MIDLATQSVRLRIDLAISRFYRPFMNARVAADLRSQVLPSTCGECSAHCGSLLTLTDGRITHVAPNPAHPYSKGAFCIKGIRGTAGITYHEKRLLHPLQRAGERGSGAWQRISWDEALDAIADGLARARQTYGPLSLAGAVSNANCNRGVTIPLLLRSLGSPNVLINQDLCGGCRGVSGRVTGLDITRGEDIEHSKCALVVGRNSYAADPVEWMALKNLKKRGGRVIVLDPKRTPAAEIADLWLRARPGTDAAIGLAMMNVLIAENLYDRHFVERWCHGYERLRERVERFTPGLAETITGVPSADIVAAARFYAGGPSVFVSGHGIDAFSGGVQTFRAFHCLVAISGNVDRIGGNLRSRKPRGFRDFMQVVHDPAFRLPRDVEEKRIGADKFPLWSGPEGWQAACHNPSVMDAILTGRPYPVRAMYVSGVNPVVTYPNTQKTVEALRSLDFLAVASDMMTPTAELADIVLPKTTGFEEEDVKLAHAAAAVTYTWPAIPPRGEARCDLDIAIGLIDRMQARNAVTKNLFRWRTQREFVEYLLGDSGITVDQLRQRGFVEFPLKTGNFAERPFPTKTGKIELYSERLAAIGLDPLPNYSPRASTANDSEPERFPLLLLTGDREKTYHHSRFREQDWAKKVSPHPLLLVHPETAAAFSLADKQWVRLETSKGRGSCRLMVKVTDATPKGVVSTGMGWWNPDTPGPEHGACDININAALSYDGPWDPMSGSADTRGMSCRVIPIETA